jgi:putative copper resistance protein D
MNELDVAVLVVHLFAAVLFVGGSFFFWLVLEPVTYSFTNDESERTRMVAQVARRFGQFTHPLLIVLVVTGIFNTTWYLPSLEDLGTTTAGQVLLVKGIVVLVLVALIYLHGAYYGPRIVRLARERRYAELRALRRRSRAISMINLALMLAVLLLAVLLQSVA